MYIYLIAAYAIFASLAALFFWHKARMQKELEAHLKAEVLQAQKLRDEAALEARLARQQLADQVKFSEGVELKLQDTITKLSGDLMNHMLQMHNVQVKEANDHAASKIAHSSSAFTSELVKLQGVIEGLMHQVNFSKDSVDQIKNALLSPCSAGQLAEITMENILNSSGLKQGIDYFLQHTLTDDENRILRPDAIVRLPGQHLLVIDAKSSQFFLRDEGQLAKSMNAHLKSLGSKAYAAQAMESFGAHHAITLMFLPTEHAVEKVMNADCGFMERAWAQSVYLVGPCGLMNLLSIARLKITDQMRLENYQEIMKQINELLGAIATMSEHATKVGTSLHSAILNYDRFAASFNRTFMARVRQIQKLSNGNLNHGNTLQRYQVTSSNTNEI